VSIATPGAPHRRYRRCARAVLIVAIGLGWLPAGRAEEPAWLRQYKHALYLLWSQVYPRGGETLYCGAHFGPEKGAGIDAEHVFPMAWVTRSLGCGARSRCRETSPHFNRIETDLYDIFPALSRINKARGARRYGMISGERREYGRCDFEVDAHQVEPRPQVRGDIARAMFYMSARYALKIYPGQGALLKRWNAEDPPDAGERQRNRRIARVQGNRNPFVDDPALADHLHF